LSLIATLGGVVFAAHGGIDAVFQSRAQMDAALCGPAVTGDLAGCGVVNALVRVPFALLLIALVGLRGWRRHGWGYVALLLAALGTVATANPVSAARFWFGAVTIGVIGVVARDRPNIRVAFWSLFPLALIAVFPHIDFARTSDWLTSFGLQLQLLFQKQDFDAFQQTMNGLSYVSAYGLREGSQLLTSLLFFVPRAVWEGKSLPTGTLVTTSLGITSNTNVSAPLWEEAYVDFGLIGVLVILSVGGFAVGLVERHLQSPGGHAGVAGLFAPFVAGYSFFVLRGSLLPAMGLLVVALLLIAGVGLISGSWATVDAPSGRTRILAAPPHQWYRSIGVDDEQISDST
jgi:hypothetical protein